MAARPRHATGDTSRNWTSFTSAASAGSWAFHGRTVTNQEVLHRSSMPGVEVLIMKAPLRWTGHVMRMDTAFFQNSSSVPNWLTALTGRVTRQSATKTPSRTLCAPVTSLSRAGSTLQQIIVLGGWQPTMEPKPSRKGDCHSLTSNAKPEKSRRPTQLLP